MEPRGQCTTEVCGPVGLMEPGPGPNIPAVTVCAMVMKRRRLLYLAGLGWAVDWVNIDY